MGNLNHEACRARVLERLLSVLVREFRLLGLHGGEVHVRGAVLRGHQLIILPPGRIRRDGRPCLIGGDDSRTVPVIVCCQGGSWCWLPYVLMGSDVVELEGAWLGLYGGGHEWWTDTFLLIVSHG